MPPISAETSRTIEGVLARFGVQDATIRDIRSGRVNKHWRIEAKSGCFVLRRYHVRRPPEAIRYEHQALRHVAGCGWPVAVARDAEGDTFVEEEGRLYALFPLLPGRPAPYTSVRYSRMKGRLLARLHEDLATWEAPGQREGFGRVWELDTYVSAQCKYVTLNELLMAFGQQHLELARAVRAQKYAMLRELSTLGYGELAVTPGHFDFHHDNLLFQRGELSGLLDFDFVHLDARVADIAESIALGCLAPPAYNEIDPAAVRAFVSGYTEHTPLSDGELQLIVPLLNAAIVWMVSWRLAQWAESESNEALPSIRRSVESRFPGFNRIRGELEAAVLQSQQMADDRQS